MPHFMLSKPDRPELKTLALLADEVELVLRNKDIILPVNATPCVSFAMSNERQHALWPRPGALP